MNKNTNLYTYLIALLMLSFGFTAEAMESEVKKHEIENQEELVEQLRIAATNGELEKVKGLIESGAPVNAKDRYGCTALSCAAEYGHKSCCETLLKSGALVNEKDVDEQTPLMWAAMYNHQSCCETLLNSDALVNEANKFGWTALMCAARGGHLSCCETLLKYNASINEKTNYGKTALMIASQWRSQSYCELLVEVMLGIWDVHLNQAYATLFCMKKIQDKDDNEDNFIDLMEPVIQRLCFAQKMDKEDVRAEVNRIENAEIKLALLKKYFSEEEKK